MFRKALDGFHRVILGLNWISTGFSGIFRFQVWLGSTSIGLARGTGDPEWLGLQRVADHRGSMGTAAQVSFGEDRESVIMKQVQHRHDRIISCAFHV